MELSKGHTWKVLDKGYLKYIDSMGSDEDIIDAARMSTGRGFVSWEAYKRCKGCDQVLSLEQECLGCDRGTGVTEFPRGDCSMLEFIYSHKHMTPFEMGELIVEFKCPIVVVWEWVRHRTQSYNIESGRYVQLADEHYLPEPGRFRKQSKQNRQDSGVEMFDPAVAQAFIKTLEMEQRNVYRTYDDLVDQGVAKELARLNAPMSRYTRGRAKANLRNWLAFLILRKQSHHSKPQWEIAQFAEIVGLIVKTLFPRTYALFEEHTLYSVTFSKSEMEALRALVTLQDPHKAANVETRYVTSMLAKLRGD